MDKIKGDSNPTLSFTLICAGEKFALEVGIKSLNESILKNIPKFLFSVLIFTVVDKEKIYNFKTLNISFFSENGCLPALFYLTFEIQP